MNKGLNKPVLNKRIFWDINFDGLDYDKKEDFVIERVFNRGDVKDIRECRRYYGDQKITKSLLSTSYISKYRIHLASAILNKPLSAFKCYTQRQSNPALYPY
jgi:uncharacterized protein DUF6922